jgi:hydroxyacylglutathione hydrolase
MTSELPEAPRYFSQDAEMNRSGAPALEELPRPTELSPAALKRLSDEGYMVLDVRPAAAFGNGHVPGALHIGLAGQFASWAGTLIRQGTPILLVAEDEAGVDEGVQRLARVGIEAVKGFLGGGMYAWDKAGERVSTVAQMPVDELRHQIEEIPNLQLIDVRRPTEFANGHIAKAISSPLSHLEEHVSDFNSNLLTAVICQSGFRSSAATSILVKHGFKYVFNIVGGMTAWDNASGATPKTCSSGAPTRA